MKNRKKLAKGVVALSMVLSFGGAILAPTHEAVASGGGGCKVYREDCPGWFTGSRDRCMRQGNTLICLCGQPDSPCYGW
jgi:hypothetical protein